MVNEVMRKTRVHTAVAAFLVLRRGDQILMSMRKNTGHKDGQFSLVAGHAEENEPASIALIREAEEEIGILIDPAHLSILHIMHIKVDRNYMDLFFECHSWRGEPVNKEPEKCASIQYFPIHALPTNTVDYVAHALREIDAGRFYSEFGWN